MSPLPLETGSLIPFIKSEKQFQIPILKALFPFNHFLYQNLGFNQGSRIAVFIIELFIRGIKLENEAFQAAGEWGHGEGLS